MSDKEYLTVRDLKKSYGEGGSYTQVLKGVSIKVSRGEMCVIQGTSGSGKSTLLNCIGGLDEIDSGIVSVAGTLVQGLKGERLSDYRRDNLGFIFQFYNLVPNLTVRENIQVCEYLSKDPIDINELMAVLGLKEYTFDSELGRKVRDGSATLEELAAKASELKAPKAPVSGRQEYLEGVLNNIILSNN